MKDDRLPHEKLEWWMTKKGRFAWVYGSIWLSRQNSMWASRQYKWTMKGDGSSARHFKLNWKTEP